MVGLSCPMIKAAVDSGSLRRVALGDGTAYAPPTAPYGEALISYGSSRRGPTKTMLPVVITTRPNPRINELSRRSPTGRGHPFGLKLTHYSGLVTTSSSSAPVLLPRYTVRGLAAVRLLDLLPVHPDATGSPTLPYGSQHTVTPTFMPDACWAISGTPPNRWPRREEDPLPSPEVTRRTFRDVIRGFAHASSP